MKRLWPLAIATTIGLSILVSLGLWQIARLDEKTKLIAKLEARMEAEPISLADAIVRQANGDDIEYMVVKTQGDKDYTHTLAKITSFQGRPAWQIIVPFTSSEGIFVLLDVGPSPTKQIAEASGLNETVYGLVRSHKKGRGLFDNNNDETGNIWYWWDLPAMRSAAKAPQSAKIAPFVLQLPDSDFGATTSIRERPAKVELHNNHLGYAITWFGLAAALLAVSGFFALSLVKKSDA